MVSPSAADSSRPLQPVSPTPVNDEQGTAGRFLRSYGFQLFALLLGIALAFM
jgi:hypothetical protein